MTLYDGLKKIVSTNNILVEKSDKAYACHDQSTIVTKAMPLMVVRVSVISELIDVVKLCISYRTPIVVRAAGTGKSGGAVADSRSVVIDITHLNRILFIDPVNLFAEVEPGVVLSCLQEAVIKHGLFYPPDPASARMCTIGGNVAENASGPSTLKYGTTRDYVRVRLLILVNVAPKESLAMISRPCFVAAKEPWRCLLNSDCVYYRFPKISLQQYFFLLMRKKRCERSLQYYITDIYQKPLSMWITPVLGLLCNLVVLTFLG
jgi:hypothetical protein